MFCLMQFMAIIVDEIYNKSNEIKSIIDYGKAWITETFDKGKRYADKGKRYGCSSRRRLV